MPAQELLTTEQQPSPILLVDHEGSIGISILEQVKAYLQVVFVTSLHQEISGNVLLIPFAHDVPEIPEDSYSHIIFLPDSEKQIQDLLPAFAYKAKQDGGILVIVLQKTMYTPELCKDILAHTDRSSLIILGDIFGEPASYAKTSLSLLLAHAKRHQTMTLPSMGFIPTYPVAFIDVIVELIKQIFGNPVMGLSILSSRIPVTQLSIVHALQKNDPFLTIDFDDTQIDEKLFPKDAVYLLPDTYPIMRKIQDAYQQVELKPTIQPGSKGRESHEEEVSQEEKSLFWGEDIKVKKKEQVPFVRLVAIFFLILVVLPLISMALSLLFATQMLLLTKTSLEKGQLSSANNYLHITQGALSFSKQNMVLLNVEMSFVGLSQIGDQVQSFLTEIDGGVQGMQGVVAGAQKLQVVVLGKGTAEDITTATILLKQSIGRLQKVEESKILPKEITQAVLKESSLLTLGASLIDSLPNLLGVTQKQTYLVLFQNNMELRPGGGFIGSYALVTVEKGRVLSFALHDVYDADGQLKGHVEPPFPIRRYIPQVHLYLRDSNFDIDTSQNASVEAQLYQQEMGQAVNGVISIDLSFVKDIIGAVGGVYVPAYSQSVTKDNFFLLAETKAEKNFFPGSSQKKDFLQGVFMSLQDKITSGNVSYIKLLQAVSDGLLHKDITLGFSQSGIAQISVANQYASSLWDTRIATAAYVPDFLGINEANFGIDKVNYYIQRQIQQEVTINPTGTMSAKLTVTFVNTSKLGEWPGGVYKNYLRFILPRGATLRNVLINGEEKPIFPAVTDPLVYEKKDFIPLDGIEVEKYEEEGKTVYGMLVNVPQSQTQVLTINYDYAQSFSLNEPVLTYAVKVFKQPGVEVYPYTLQVHYPTGYALLTKQSNITNQGGVVSLSADITSDTQIPLTFAKQ